VRGATGATRIAACCDCAGRARRDGTAYRGTTVRRATTSCGRSWTRSRHPCELRCRGRAAYPRDASIETSQRARPKRRDRAGIDDALRRGRKPRRERVDEALQVAELALRGAAAVAMLEGVGHARAALERLEPGPPAHAL